MKKNESEKKKFPIMAAGAAVLAACLVLPAVISRIEKEDVITSAQLEKAIDISQLSTAEFVYNGIAEKYNEDLNVDLDEASMGEPLTDTGFFTKITKEEETAALAEAQKNMEETARSNSALLAQAKERAKNVIEGYVKNVGEQLGEEYTVEWTEAPAGASESAGTEDKGL